MPDYALGFALASALVLSPVSTILNNFDPLHLSWPSTVDLTPMSDFVLAKFDLPPHFASNVRFWPRAYAKFGSFGV